MVFLLVRELKRRHPDIRISVVLPPDGMYVQRFRSLDVPTIEFPLNRISPLHIPRFLSLVLNMRPDVLHSHGKGAGLYARMVPRFLCRARRVHSYHGFHPPHHPVANSLYRRLESVLLKRVDAVAALSKSEAAEIGAVSPKNRAKIKIMPNVVACDQLRERGEHRLPSAVESFLGRNTGRFVMTMIGRDDPVKNFPLAFRAAQATLRKSDNVCFVFVGVNASESAYAPLREKYPESVLAVPSLDNPAPLLRKSSAVLLTSRKEGSPLVVLEAFCFGKPVVGTDVPGIQDAVKDGLNGILCPENEEALAAVIERLANDVELYARLSRNALATSGEMDVTSWTEQYYKLYSHRSG